MIPADRLKLAREDYNQQETLYNTLILGQRFYIGIAVVLGGASISLANLERLRELSFTSVLIIVAAVGFWTCLMGACYQLYKMIMGEPWTLPKALDQYFKWKEDRLKQVACGKFDTKGKTPEEFAEDEMVCQIAVDYAVSTAVNREGNLSRQRRLQWIGKFLLGSLVALGLQAGSNLLYSLNHGGRASTTTTAPSATPSSTSAAAD